MSCLRPLTQRTTPFSSTGVVRSSAQPVKFWTAVMRGLLAQNEMSGSLSSDLVLVLSLGDVDLLGRSGLSADAAIRRNAHESGTLPLYRTCDGCSWRHELFNPFWMPWLDSGVLSVMRRRPRRFQRGVSVPQTVAPLRYEATEVKWLLGWEDEHAHQECQHCRRSDQFAPTSIHSSRQKHRKFFCDSIVSGHEPTEAPLAQS